ncbi:hypothetical protein ACH4OT_27850 [Streptomyces murinus]|uniref:hypothetical protein n=1 Tax=Streptomyces murinus TaxID=33900 RepID=UPI0037B8C4A4
MDTRRLPWLTIPNRPTTNPDPTGQPQHIAALQRVLADDSTSPRVRVAACLVLLFAQPVSRIVRMTTDDVVHDGQHTDAGRELLAATGAETAPISARIWGGIPAEDLTAVGRVLTLVTERANAELAALTA